MEIKLANKWWGELTHGGMLLSPAVLEELLPNGPGKVDMKKYQKLKDAYNRFTAFLDNKNKQFDSNQLSENLYQWIDAIFQDFVHISGDLWLKESKIPDDLKYKTAIGEILRPNRALKSVTGYRYLLKVDKNSDRIGFGKGRTEYSKFVELLRKSKVQIGVLTNGKQLRLIYAGLDHESWVEWETEKWFEEGAGLDLLAGFNFLCGRPMNMETAKEEEIGGKWLLLYYIQYSRIKQSDLSTVLGEQVREAVEILIDTLDQGSKDHPELMQGVFSKDISERARLNALYQAGIRIIMRLVVIFFAESRDLFPRSLEAYDQSYGLEGLYRILISAEQDEGIEDLRNSTSAWPRLLSLFKIIYEGSPFSDVPLPPYGGNLFKHGENNSDDLVLRAIGIFENPLLKITDYTILQVLRKLRIGRVKIKKGRSFTWVSGPVDFSELSAEYIGMMYEGLLDYQFRQVTAEEQAIVILKLGRQPAIPLSRLESLNDKELGDLISKLSKEKIEKVVKEGDSEGERGSEEGDSTEDGEITEDEAEKEEINKESTPESIEEPFNLDSGVIEGDALLQRVITWAKRAAEISKIVTKGKLKPEEYEKNLVKAGLGIISPEHIFGVGRYYVIQNSGNRKGSGTFYTKPQLVIPTVQRTLEPLVYNIESDGTKIPKEPENILNLKVCDPAMGSASFLVAALRYLSDSLSESLKYHHYIKNTTMSETRISIPMGSMIEGTPSEDIFTLKAIEDNPLIEQQIKSRLKRYIMERCIYGVDINPLAVELAKLSLWVETLDRDLPFTFIDHKLKVGNSMIGCTLSNFLNYPVKAWEREAGDSSHSNGVQVKRNEWSEKIKTHKNEIIKQNLVDYLRKLEGQTKLEDYLFIRSEKLSEYSNKILNSYRLLHTFNTTKISDNDKKEDFWLKEIIKNKNYIDLKKKMDLWCSIWFWPPDLINLSPLPSDYDNYQNDEILQVITDRYKFFHWEIEFPDVFLVDNPGFDSILGNPPWDTLQPSSFEYFCGFDPVYRNYGKQEALKKQTVMFEKISELEREWLLYNSDFKATKNWITNIQNPYGDPDLGSKFSLISEEINKKSEINLHIYWREIRQKISAKRRLNQGYILKGSIATYKIFVELGLSLLKKENARLGLIIPASIYGDQNSKLLREKLFNSYEWEFLFSFENRNKIFATIHGSFKFCINIIQSSGKTDLIKSAFMSRNLSDWEDKNFVTINYPVSLINSLSPKYKILFEIESERNLNILDKLYQNRIFFGSVEEKSWNISFFGELHPTNDSSHFHPLEYWISQGYIENQYCQWIGKEHDIALPIYEGRMVGQYDFSKKGWISGKGRTAIWRTIPFDKKTIEPEFLISKEECRSLNKIIRGYKISFMKIGSATNERTIIAFLDRDTPHIEGCPVLFTEDHSLINTSLLICIMNSFVFDYIARFRVSGININYNKIEESPLPIPSFFHQNIKIFIMKQTAKLSFIHIKFAPDWLYIRQLVKDISKETWNGNWAITKFERLRIRAILDAIVAYIYTLSYDDYEYILSLNPQNPKGFWRVDKDKPKEIRLTTLALTAYKDLITRGIDDFIEEEWQIPEVIQDKYKDELGPQFLDWQLSQSVEESWQECDQHARNILGDDYDSFMQDLKDGKDPFAVRAIQKEQEREQAKSESRKKSKKTSDAGGLDKKMGVESISENSPLLPPKQPSKEPEKKTGPKQQKLF